MKKLILLIGIMSLSILFSSQTSYAQRVIASTPEQQKAVEESMRRQREMRKQYEAMTPEQQAEARKRYDELKKSGNTGKTVEQAPKVERKVISKEEFEKNSKKDEKPQVKPNAKKETAPSKVKLQTEKPAVKKTITEDVDNDGRIVAKPQVKPDAKKECDKKEDTPCKEKGKPEIQKDDKTDKPRTKGLSSKDDEANKRQIHKRPEAEKMVKQDRTKAKDDVKTNVDKPTK